MGIFKSTRYRKCIQNEDSSVDCISYKPTKDGKKIVTASIKSQVSPTCEVTLVDSDGAPDEIDDLEQYLSKRTRVKCKQPSNL